MIAPIKPASSTCWFTKRKSTSPLPIVAATAVPNESGATKFQNAAQTTAQRGRRTRVDTTVAMELAASCQPLAKSKARLIKTMMTSRWKLFKRGAPLASANWRIEKHAVLRGEARSCVFQGDRFNDVGDVFAFVCGDFKNFDDF